MAKRPRLKTQLLPRKRTGEDFTKLLPREAGKGDRRAASAVVEGAQGGPNLRSSPKASCRWWPAE
jgi:hypothetical protein